MRALIIADLQNDFMAGGAVAVPDADALIPLVNRLQGQFRLVVATQDWHPPNHISFAANHRGRRPGDTAQLRKRRQLLWPVHCVQHTRGAEFASALMFNRINRVVRKGIDAEIDGYSGFYDDDHQRATGLVDFLREKGANEVYLCGVAIEHCIRNSAQDALGLGLKVWLITDACRGYDREPGAAARVMDALAQAGVQLMGSADLLGARRRTPPQP